MKNKTCCFTGHRSIPSEQYVKIKAELRKEIINLINKGVIYFGSGGAFGFDILSAEVVLELKKQYPQIKLIMVFPCKNHTKYWSKKDIEKYEHIKRFCDKYVYVSEKYDYDCMKRRNRYLVNFSEYCICYFNQPNSGTAYTVNYAEEKGLTIINIANK